MTEEQKRYVNAYMDGEEVEYSYTDSNFAKWRDVEDFEDFSTKVNEKIFRIKPKAEDKWQRVKKEEYLCRFWGVIDQHGYLCKSEGALKEDSIIGTIYKDSSVQDGFRINNAYGTLYNNCEVLREKGIKQPYFQGDDIPKIDGQVVIYFKSGVVDMMYADELAWDWSEAVAYIEI